MQFNSNQCMLNIYTVIVLMFKHKSEAFPTFVSHVCSGMACIYNALFSSLIQPVLVLPVENSKVYCYIITLMHVNCCY